MPRSRGPELPFPTNLTGHWDVAGSSLATIDEAVASGPPEGSIDIDIASVRRSFTDAP
jgi:hypothetical protein